MQAKEPAEEAPPPVLREQLDARGVLHLLIDRESRRNALGAAVLDALAAALARYADDTGVRVLVLRGAGTRCFAAGGDLKELQAVRSETDATAMSRRARAVLDAVRDFPLPTIAALNGDALGGGAELAMACDLRVAAPQARLGFIQGQLALATAWGGGIDLMQRLGPGAALRLLAQAQPLGSDAALRQGLLDAVADGDQPSDLDATVETCIAPFLDPPVQVLRAHKALAAALRRGADRVELAAIETAHFAGTWAHDDHWAAVAARSAARKAQR